MKPKLLFITGSRGEWGYIRPVLRLCQQTRDFDFSLCVTNMHVLPSFGLSKQQIEQDGFSIEHTIYMALDGYNHYTMVKSLGVFLISLADILASSKPDWIVLAGDRGEQMMGALAGAHCYVPVAHIQAGELSGNIDGMTRHAIGKYAHVHFAANNDAAERLHKLGEEPFRIHMVGAPQLDELVQGMHTSPEELERKHGINLSKPYVLVVQHPVTEEFSQAGQQIQMIMRVLKDLDCTQIMIMPNNDAGSNLIREGIKSSRHGEVFAFSNLKREDYLGLLKGAQCIIGNSSSGLLEAPSFGVPAVNIGRRQAMRVRGNNVLDVPFEERVIRQAIRKAMSPEFRAELKRNCSNPYGDGKSSARILKVLRETPVTDKLLAKNLTY